VAGMTYSLQEGSDGGIPSEVELDQPLLKILLVFLAQLQLLRYPAVEELRAGEFLQDRLFATALFLELVVDELADVFPQGFLGGI
jgi:hypothetical protein